MTLAARIITARRILLCNGLVDTMLPFALKLRARASQVIVFTSGTFEVPDDTRLRLESAGVRIETAPVKRLVGADGRLEAIELQGGASVPCEVLFVHPPQRQIELIATLGVEPAGTSNTSPSPSFHSPFSSTRAAFCIEGERREAMCHVRTAQRAFGVVGLPRSDNQRALGHPSSRAIG